MIHRTRTNRLAPDRAEANQSADDPMRPGQAQALGINAHPAGTQAAHEQRLLRLPQVLAMTARGRTATLDDVKAGRFPRPIKIGSATFWVYGEVQAWIDDRIRAARGAQ